MIHREAWYREADNLLTKHQLIQLPSNRLLRMLESPERRTPDQTVEEWWAEQERVYDLLVERGVFDRDLEPPSEDVQQRRIKWREWYRRKVQEDPEWHQRYLERVRQNEQQMTPEQRKRKTDREVERQRERYKTDDSYAEKKREQARQRYQEHKRRMKEDPAYAEEQRRKNREKKRRSRERQRS